MKRSLILFAFCCLGALSLAAGESFHVYAPSRASSELLVVEVSADGDALRLKLVERKPLGFKARTIADHPKKQLLYVGSGSGKDGEFEGASIELNDDGTVKAAHAAKLPGSYSYMSLDRSNRFLLGASYGNGQVDVMALDENGLIGKRVAGVNEGRKNAHAVLVSPDNGYVYIPYVKDNNALFQYRFNAETGALTALKPKDAGPPEGTGPRHIAYHPKLPMVYFSNEQGIGLSVYKKNADGTLTIREVSPAIPADRDKDGISNSDLAITPDGKFIFLGIRGHRQDFDRIARYAVEDDGTVKLLGLTPADAIPWGFALSPGGKYLLVSAFKGETLKAYTIGEDGDLTLAASLDWDPQISDLVTR